MGIFTTNGYMSTLVTVGTASVLAGCGGNFNSIHNDFLTKGHRGLSIDAKQRVVYSVEKNFGPNKKWTAICAEPSPDALSALSTSGSLNLSVLEKALGASGGSQESAASIGLRTQTIQILRDGMYRLCEGYASGALDNVGYRTAQRRYQDVTLALLAIEQLTGSVVANQAAISNQTTSAAEQGIAGIKDWIGTANKELVTINSRIAGLETSKKTADTALAAAEKKFAELEEAGKTSAEKKAEAAAYKLADLATAQKAATQAASDVAQANTKKDGIVDGINKLVEAQRAASSAAATQIGTVVLAGGSTASTISDQTAQVIADAVVKIVEGTQDVDYGKEFCIETLADIARNYSEDELKLSELKLSGTRLPGGELSREAKVRLAEVENRTTLVMMIQKYCGLQLGIAK